MLRPVLRGGMGVLGRVRRFKWTGYGVEKLRDYDQPLIFASNHCSHADTAAIMGTLPFRIRRKTCVAAALDVFGPANYVPKRTWKWFKRECLQTIVAAAFHAFAFDRLGPPLRSLRTALDLMDHGWSVLLYPEGTRSRTGEMGPFKPGVGLMAKSSGRPVVPVHVTGGRDILPCKIFLPRPGHVIVRFGRPLYREPDESPVAFTRRIEQQVRKLARVAEREPQPEALLGVGRKARLAALVPGSFNHKNDR
jgi:long-chain acyl-CoA synthetase